ncbi:Farnesyl cysteine-carboxyl methyltransferase [Handroanthus impetiginosus]|uniref:Protein-S-isoprenylcysteine O-methyltransferase n=1 Tax=Handroanthus impetiginosus TaxID=429701 RepID=A0A2G9HHT9_9LAMI|nr:Farnesyl cysteine-carboxyl methyltransferase [Handroanthus impetiginosus]
MSVVMYFYDELEFQLSSVVSFSSAMTSEMFSFTACRQLLQMFFAVIFFHCSEYALAIVFHGKSSVTVKSLLISNNYVLAMVGALVEYFIELYFFPGMKEHWLVSNIGLFMVVIGEIIRKLAIITAGRSFTHLIKRYHEEHHVLVTDGIYKYIRHPSYCGFLIWSVGTQIMLCNPLSTLAFAVVVWNFFKQRIPYEEFFLRQFFGSEYEEYARQTTSGIPLIKAILISRSCVSYDVFRGNLQTCSFYCMRSFHLYCSEQLLIQSCFFSVTICFILVRFFEILSRMYNFSSKL